MIWNKAKFGRIFISYRREDSRDFAGRLSDTLGHYFGDDRVFQDIDDIAAGANFGDVLNETLNSADAVIVLIGKHWLSITDQHDNPRLGQADDWVTAEVSFALDKGIPVFPVLMDGTPMPRSDELPDQLKSLANHNAQSISADRWHSDVTRLARSIALDIPSATERKLALVNRIVSLSLLLAVVIPTSFIAWNIWHEYIITQSNQPLIEPWHTALSFLFIVPSSALLFVFARDVDDAKQLYFYASAYVGALGAAISYILYWYIDDPVVTIAEAKEGIVIYFSGVIIAATMLALANLSGFKSK